MNLNKNGKENNSNQILEIQNRYTSFWVRLIFLGLAISILILYGFGFKKYLDYIRAGVIGAYCTVCDPAFDKPELTIVPNSPADQAGVLSGDKLLAVDGIAPLDLPDSDPYLTDGWFFGEVDEEIILTIERPNGSIEDITIVREAGWSEFSTIGILTLGASQKFTLTFAIVTEIILFLGFAVSGIIMVFRKDDNWMLMLSGLAMLMIITHATRGALFIPFNNIKSALFIIALTTIYTLFFVFPDGRILSRKAYLAIIGYFIWLIINSIFIRPLLGSFDYTRLLDSVFWATAIASQVYRFRNHSSPEQQQQIKWVIVGFIGVTIQRSLFLALGFLLPALSLPATSTVLSHSYWSIGDIISRFLILFLPLTFIFAISQYRLWDIDYLINRSLVYGALIIFLLLIFVAVLMGLQIVLDNLGAEMQNAKVAVLSASVAVVLVFNRARIELIQVVDSRYGIKIKYNDLPKDRDKEIPILNVLSPDRPIELRDFTNLDFVAAGGMGEIYKANHPDYKHPVAIKILQKSLVGDKTARRRFLQEAQIITQLNHPNIIKVYDFSESEDTLFMVMEYIEGIDLGKLINNENQISLKQICQILSIIGDALDYAHTQGLVHRDIKPANIMLEYSGNEQNNFRPVLMDFGIARIIQTSTITGTAGMVGTVSYMSPEQISESLELDHRTDIYSTGVMLYEMLTGKLPFENKNIGAVLLAHLNQPPPDPRLIRPDISLGVVKTLYTALEKDPNLRYANVGQMVKSICVE